MLFSVCFLALEYFGWGKFGGIGKATRDIAEGLAKRGVEPHAIVPRGKDQKSTEIVEGVNVHSFQLSKYHRICEIIRKVDADIYHSQDPTPGTVIAMSAMPDSKHMMTCQNPKTKEDWSRVNQFYPLRRRLYNLLVEPRVSEKIKELDAVYCQCNFIREKASKCYGLDYKPDYLPNPVKMLKDDRKNEAAKVCFLGRFDGEKNPERFFGLAERLSEENFDLLLVFTIFVPPRIGLLITCTFQHI